MKQSFGYKYARHKRKQNRINVSNYLYRRLSSVPKGYYPAMRGRLQNVQVITPAPLFPQKALLSTTYSVT